MNKRLFLSIAVSIAIIGFIFYRILNFQEFVTALSLVSLPLFFASDIPYLLQALLMGHRLHWAMQKSGVEGTFRDSLFAHLLGMLGSDFSIGRTAYLFASLPFKSSLSGNVGVLSALISVDVIVKALLAMVASVYFLKFYLLKVNFVLILFAVAVLIAGAMFIAVLTNPFGERFVTKFPFVGNKVLPFYIQFRNSVVVLKKELLFLSAFSFMGWLLRGFEWWILGQAIGINLGFITWLMLHPILTLVRLIPITVTGLGIFELTLIGLFPAINASKLVTFGICDMFNNAFIDVFGLLAIRKMKQ